MQIAYISNRPEIALETLEHVAGLMPFVTRAVIVCPAALIGRFRAAAPLEMAVLDEAVVLGERRARFEASADHQVRNWLLRASLAGSREIDEEFIMSDDDNRPLVEIGLDFYKESGRYHSYYFYDLARWRPRATDYDLGQHATRELLEGEGLPTLSYSAHMPQIVSRRLFAEAAAWYEEKPGSDRRPVDEWSLYFNYAQRRHPELFHPPRPFRTLCWPALPTDWEYDVRPPVFELENFYPRLYRDDGIFAGIPRRFDARAQPSRTRMKIERRQELQRIYDSPSAVARRKAAWLARRVLLRSRGVLERHRGWRRLERIVPARCRQWARDLLLHGDDPAWTFPHPRRRRGGR